MRKLGKILKNKKGFTLVEAIAVVAIMGVLATVIGGLVTAGTTAYMRQKESASAKDLGTIVQNEIKRAAKSSLVVYLQDGDLPTDTNVIYNDDNQEVGYQIKNAPSGELKMFAAENGRLVYSTDRGTTTQEYFTDPSRESEGRAFYGSFTINVYFKPIINTFGEITSVKVYCDVYNKKGQLKFDSPGLEIDFIEADYTPSSKDKDTFLGIFSFKTGEMASIILDGEGNYQYKNMLLDANYSAGNAKGFTKFYFRTVADN